MKNKGFTFYVFSLVILINICMWKNKMFGVDVQICDYVVDKTGAGDCVTGVFCIFKSIGTDDGETLQKAVNIATKSIKNYGMLHLVKDY